MKLTSFSFLIFFCLFLGNGRFVWADTYSSGDFYSPLSIKIKMEKDVFQVREAVKGKVEVENVYPGNIPAVFDIKLFHDDKPVSESTTAIQHVPSGTTAFSFQAFGIANFNDDSTAVGIWRIIIVQQNLDASYTKEATVRIVPSEKKMP